MKEKDGMTKDTAFEYFDFDGSVPFFNFFDNNFLRFDSIKIYIENDETVVHFIYKNEVVCKQTALGLDKGDDFLITNIEGMMKISY
jgi:hypothetical protein